jgi:spore germination protein GerM
MARKRSRSGLGVLFWIAFILLVLVVFLVNRPRIERVLESTQLVEVLQRRLQDDAPAADEPDEIPPDETPSPRDTAPARETEPDEDVDVPDALPEVETDILSDDDEDVSDEEPPENEVNDDGSDDVSSDEPDPTPQPSPMRIRNSVVYYIRVTDDGRIHPEGVEREVEYQSAPLSRSIDVLLDGLTSRELSQGLLNLIPEGSVLLSASIRNGVAYLNFNEAFLFNPMGVEGYRAQLAQIVYSATEFSTIDRVQFLIEGQNQEWLGGEGVNIGTPLGRDSFSS